MDLQNFARDDDFEGEVVSKGTLTKAQLCEKLTDEFGFPKRQARNIVELFFDELRACLERGEMIKLSGFGSFQLRDKPERPGRNPKTGKEIAITARRVVTFHPSPKVRNMVEEQRQFWEQA